MSTYLNVLVLLLQVLESNGSDDKNTDYNNCLMWRDDLTTVMVTCRVPNLSIPVEFVHNETMEIVMCFGHRITPFCTPNDKRVTFNQSAESVTIVLEEEKLGGNLDGIWYCRQGKSIRTSKISISEGLLMDTQVRIEGKPGLYDDGSRYIDVQCSSCRQAHHLSAEFFYNGKTVASVWQDDVGKCFHKNLICTEDVCNCSKAGNLFSVRLNLTDNNPPAKIGCEMQFSDDLRNGLFAILAYSNYNESGFTSTDTNVTILKDNVAVPTRQYSTNTEEATRDASITTNMPSTENGLSVRIVITFVLTVVSITIVFFLVICIWLYQRKVKKECGIELRSILLSDTIYCGRCSELGTNKRAEYMCLDCGQCVCLTCCRICNNSIEETKQHTTVKLKLVPNHFTVSMFTCSEKKHQNALLQYYCQTHKKVICESCKSSVHSSCEVQMIANISAEKVSLKLSDYLGQLLITEGQLISLKHSMNWSVESYKSNTLFVQRHIESSSQEQFQVEKDKECFRGLSKRQAIKRINEVKDKFVEKAECFTLCLINQHRNIEKVIESLEFVLQSGRLNLVLISTTIFTEKLIALAKKLDEEKEKISCLDIYANYERGIININKVPFKEFHSSYHLRLQTASSNTNKIEGKYCKA